MNDITFDETPELKRGLSIGEAWSSLFRDPGQFIRYWNYKGAVLSGVLRAPIFLITYLVGRESIKLAVGAAVLQFAFRFLFAGLSGAMIQSFRRVEPPWKALASILMVVPLISHLFEYGLQAAFAYLTASGEHTDQAIVRSVCVSVFSALFALFIMRRNVMIVGEAESKSLLSDVMRIPILVFEFFAFVPNEISAMLRRGAFVMAGASIAIFGVFSQIIGWAVTTRTFWTFGGGKEIPAVKYWGVDGMILLIMAVIVSTIVYGFYHKGIRRSRD